MKRLTTYLGLLLISIMLRAQPTDSLNLWDCYVMARKNAPKLQALQLIEQQRSIEEHKLNTQYRPQVSAYGKAWYQSDAIAVPPSPVSPGMEIERFQYNAAVNIDQKLFDAGLINVQKELNTIQGNVKKLETEVGLYGLNDLVNQLFFGIISMDNSKNILALKIETLQKRQQLLKSGLEQGVVVPAEYERIVSEVYSSQQQIEEIEMAKQKLEVSLKIYLGIAPEQPINWVLPEIIVANDTTATRPEFDLFAANRELLTTSMKIQDKRYIPQLSAYGQVGYTYPGLNFFENEAAPFYLAGLKLSWNIFDWNMAKSEKQLIQVNMKHIDIQETEFSRKITVATNETKVTISKMQELMKQDNKIIESRSLVTKASASALDNGTITSADFLNDLNAELKARFDFERHKLNYIEASANLALLTGIKLD